MIVLPSRGASLSAALKRESSGQKLGTSVKCFQLRDLHRMSLMGWTLNEHAHIRECMDCRVGYNNFMKIKRNEARMALRLDPYEDVAGKVFGVRIKDRIG